MDPRLVESIYGRKVDVFPQAIKIVIVKNEILDIFLMGGIWCGKLETRNFEVLEENLEENQGNCDRVCCKVIIK